MTRSGPESLFWRGLKNALTIMLAAVLFFVFVGWLL